MNNKITQIRLLIFSIIKSSLLISAMLFNQSCQTESDSFTNNQQENIIVRENITAKFENLLINTVTLLEKTIEIQKSKKKINKNSIISEPYLQSEEKIEQLTNGLVHEAKDLLNHFGYGEAEIMEDFKNPNDHRIALLGLMVLSVKNNYEAKVFSSSLNNSKNNIYYQKGGGDARTCFLEATGIAAGVALVGALTASTMDKKLVKRLMKKAAKKIGARVIGGIGLILVAADFAYCMLKEKYSIINVEISCNELVQIGLISSNGFIKSNNYYLLKKDINYKSREEFEILPYRRYNVYNLNNTITCEGIDKYPYQIDGRDFDKSTISDFSIKQLSNF